MRQFGFGRRKARSKATKRPPRPKPNPEEAQRLESLVVQRCLRALKAHWNKPLPSTAEAADHPRIEGPNSNPLFRSRSPARPARKESNETQRTKPQGESRGFSRPPTRQKIVSGQELSPPQN